MRILYLGLILISMIWIQSCDTVSETCDPACNDWEQCKKVEGDYEDTFECTLQKDRCTTQADCTYPQSCDIRTKWCIGKCEIPCESWERCSLENECIPLEDYCSSNSDCSGEKSACNPKTHKCDYECETECRSWQYCTEDKECKADEENNFCDTDSNCKDGKVCNTKLHKCVYDGCEPKCEGWQTCNSEGVCEIAAGRCDPKLGCERNTGVSYTCNPNNNLCEKDAGVCTPLCSIWETCNFKNECVAAEGYCNKNADCSSGENCSSDHICVPIIGAGCENDNECNSWEHCEEQRCKLKEDACNLSDDCNGDAVCNFSSHQCENICEQPCQYWEKCESTQNGTESPTTSCVIDDDFCQQASDCNNNQNCNPQTHKCETKCEESCEPWGNCEADGQCSTNDGYCDETSDCGTTFAYSASCDLTTHTCEEDPSSSCDPFCKAWEICAEGDICQLATGRCNKNSDCGANKYCSRETHTCKPEASSACDPSCEDWQKCDENNTCKDIEGTCNSTSDCNGTDVCDTTSHECKDPDPSGCDPLCSAWEVCSNNSCTLRDERCNADNDCSNGKTCNTTSHLCENTNCNPSCESWENCNSNGSCSIKENRCNENSDCPSDFSCNKSSHTCTREEYCDETSDCGTTYGYSATCDLTTHTCEEDPSGSCDPFCKAWEICTEGNTCQLATNRCNKNSDCGANKYCSRETHTCKPEASSACDPSCEDWQKCDENNTCKDIEGTCNSTSDCNGTDVCDTTSHECKDPDPSGCDPLCSAWEVCSNNSCTLRDERCNANNDCSNGEICNTTSHLCEDSSCNLRCQDWESCNNNNCITNEGRCNDGGDCPSNKYCELETNTCRTNNNNEVCNPECEDWEKCSSNRCSLNAGFCAENNDCPAGERCSQDHKCIGALPNACETSSDCESWQICSTSKQCIPAEGHCESNNNCSNSEICNPDTHICEEVCQIPCEYWQECSSGGVCTDQDGYCSNNSNCESDEICNSNHKCEKTCSPACEDYEICDSETIKCKTHPGLCENNSDCEDKHTCSENNTCEPSCSITCNEWEVCTVFNGEETCALDSGRCSDQEYIDGLVLENYGCVSSSEHIEISCDLSTHTCFENKGVCEEICEAWEECTLDNVCKPQRKMCNTNQDCYDGLICDIETHNCVSSETVTSCFASTDCENWEHCSVDGACVLDVNACAKDSDCINNRWCDTSMHECVKNADECFPECGDWQECYRGICIAKETNFLCDITDYCGPYSLCSSETHQCENISDSCENCNPWEVCLSSGCSLIFGTCNTSADCSHDKSCNQATHLCEDKSCRVDAECNPTLNTEDKLCKKEEGASTGRCMQVGIQGVREFHGYDKTSLKLNPIQDYVEGEILEIYKDSAKREIGFYLYKSPSKAFGDSGPIGYERSCNCDSNGENCDQNSKSNIELCPLKNYLYRGIYVSFLESEYDTVKNYKIGDTMAGYVRYVNHYGMSVIRAIKTAFIRSNDYCEHTTPEGRDLCDQNSHCTSEDICRSNTPFDPFTYDIRLSQILRTNHNKAEAFESSLINAEGNKPYTVIENASASNHNRIKLKDAYDDEFYIDKDLSEYNLSKGKGQCVNNLCKKESWTACNKYCEYGFKLIQEDTDKDTRGDTCQNSNDSDNDGLLNTQDNCPYNYNPTQNNMDGDSKGDACDDDVDGDGWINNDDNCPMNSNSDQKRTINCSKPTNAHYLDDNTTGYTTKQKPNTLNTFGCEWACNDGYTGPRCSGCEPGYHSVGSSCVIDETCEDNTCTQANKTVCSVENGIAVCSCDIGFHPSGNNCVANTKAYHSFIPNIPTPANSNYIAPPPRGSAFGDACDHAGDRDWDGVSNELDNCPNTFNPDQGDYDEDGIGDYCDPDIDGDKFLNNEDNCIYHKNPILCKICECNPAPTNEYSCTNDNACQNIMVRGQNSGDGKCHHYETTLRTLKGVLKYEHVVPASTMSCMSSSDCSAGETCKLFNDSSIGGECNSGNKPNEGLYIIMPRSTSDFSKCTNESCTR